MAEGYNWNDEMRVDWNKFYGETCPVCKKPVMTKEWRRHTWFVSSGLLRDNGYKADRHAKFRYMTRFGNRHKYYPVHEECFMKVADIN